MRAPPLPIATLALASLVTGCGGGSSARSLRTSGITKPEATAYAHRVNLGVADVPGMVSTSLEGERHERDAVDAKCRLHEIEAHLVDVRSPSFRSGRGLDAQAVNSDVEVLASSNLAERKLANERRVLATARDRACLARTYTDAFVRGLRRGVPGGVRLIVGHTTLAVVHPSVPRSVGLRIVVPFTVVGPARSISSKLEVDGMSFAHGPAFVNLLATGTRVSAATERHLLSVLYDRAKE